jgi:hypothetical protein
LIRIEPLVTEFLPPNYLSNTFKQIIKREKKKYAGGLRGTSPEAVEEKILRFELQALLNMQAKSNKVFGSLNADVTYTIHITSLMYRLKDLDRAEALVCVWECFSHFFCSSSKN